ncbi:MAG: GMC oxidoreductase, partial [Actinomycetota bacterium]
LVVNVRAVVIAGGAIETPALLLHSGLKGQVGRNLRLHPGTAVWGLFDEGVRVWEGTLQARYSAEFRDVDGHYGPVFETVPVHPGSGSAAIPWTSAREHRSLMERFGDLSLCAVLPRDDGAGRVTIDRDGQPKISYSLTAGDERRIAQGVVAAGKLLEAAGAMKLYTMQRPSIGYAPGFGGGHDGWADEVRSRGFKTGNMTFFSYHQMGSARMGMNPATSAIDGDNQTHEVEDLYVMDGSAFPTASGVNPMLSIYGIAHRAATRLAERL